MINIRKPGMSNLGDSMNVPLVEYITGEQPNAIKRTDEIYKVEVIYLVIGSCLQLSHKNTIVWGAGYISENSKVVEVPKAIYAVRGPKTCRRLHEQGITCPEVFGDPALLYPRYYKPKVQKKYKLGIVPHYVDKCLAKEYEDVLIVDVQGSVNKVVNQILSCKYIASSSLHGLIVADAYGIPSTWIEYSKRVVGRGFKFWDYFSSVGRKLESPLQIDARTTIKDIMDRFYEYDIEIDLDKLYNACPFKK